tara:strand:- start:9349 stop:9711 length:363 start_codon:yes stop_codon:yes gene_type:complete
MPQNHVESLEGQVLLGVINKGYGATQFPDDIAKKLGEIIDKKLSVDFTKGLGEPVSLEGILPPEKLPAKKTPNQCVIENGEAEEVARFFAISDTTFAIRVSYQGIGAPGLLLFRQYFLDY